MTPVLWQKAEMCLATPLPPPPPGLRLLVCNKYGLLASHAPFVDSSVLISVLFFIAVPRSFPSFIPASPHSQISDSLFISFSLASSPPPPWGRSSLLFSCANATLHRAFDMLWAGLAVAAPRIHVASDFRALSECAPLSCDP